MADDEAAGRVVTIKDVARRAGVALGTVSRILNGNTTVAPELRQHVQAVIDEMGYRPRAVARSMRSGRTRAIGCVVSDMAQPVAASMLAGAESVLRGHGYAMIVAATHYDDAREHAVLSFMAERGVDGLLIAVNRDDSAAAAAALAGVSVPVVLWERDVGGRYDAAITEHGAGMRAAMHHLIKLGHRDIAVIAGHRETLVGREQVGAHAAALKEIGLSVRDAFVHHTDRLDAAALSDLIAGAWRPTAIVANIHDIPAILRTARETGVSVPGDLSLISIGDSDVLEVLTPSVTAVRGSGARVGEVAAALLMQRMTDPGVQLVTRRIRLPTELISRDSCAAVTTSVLTVPSRINS